MLPEQELLHTSQLNVEYQRRIRGNLWWRSFRAITANTKYEFKMKLAIR